MSDRPKPSLDDARARIGRAKEHITRLEHEISAILPPNQTITRAVMGPAFLSRSSHRIDVPPIVTILIGETIYNLRSALDYLVYELFYLDTGKIKKNTKFPVESSPKEWNKYFPFPGMLGKQRHKLWLYRLSTSHQAAIKALQPCFGCKWTAPFSSLSNLDKHRHLTVVEATAEHMGHGAIAGPGAVMVSVQVASKIAFQDGSLVVETLKLFEKEISDVIEAFDPDFQ
jgi:hypothetical protein